IITGDRNQKWICKMKVGIPDVRSEIVTQPQGETETVETLGREHCEVTAPEIPVMIPAFVLHVAGEETHVSADLVGRLFDNLSLGGYHFNRVPGVVYLVRQLQ